MEHCRRPRSESALFDEHVRPIQIAASEDDVAKEVECRVADSEAEGNQIDIHRLLGAFALGKLAVFNSQLSTSESTVDEQGADQ
jgi:hypothetical protein